MRLAACLALLAVAVPALAQDRTPLPPGADVVTREAWGGTPPVAPMVPHTPSALTVHHSGTPMNRDRTPAETLRGLLAFSTRRDTLGDGRVKEPWADVPYHFYIAPDGTTMEARDVAFQGDTNTRYDLSGQLLVVLEGNFEEEAPTDAQMASLLALSEALARQWGFGPTTVAGHRDRAPGQTVCPGDALDARLPDVRAAVERGARRALDGAWLADLRPTPNAAPDPRPLSLSVGAGHRLSGTFDGAPILDGRLDAQWDAARFTFSTETADGPSVTHGVLRGGRLHATSTSGGALVVWSADRAE